MSPAAPRIKICGITRLEDALLAASLGADAVGFNFWPGSKRYLAPAAARPLVAALPAGIRAFGVFVNPSRETVLDAVARSGVGTVQLHGDEEPALCMGLGVPVVKAIRVSGRGSLTALVSYEVEAFLLDADSSGFGGSGARFDWTVAAEVARELPVWLAGGLTPENVAAAIRTVRPLGVDVASGVEAAPGVKDPAKLRKFIEAARQA
ncbi:MAG TPA: phosphoribosylanthranilate isomerase [Anaeromyxobacter sp.]|nr:phosphoribosylanthranilate isomerase [Anaeromyxobacter sp.]